MLCCAKCDRVVTEAYQQAPVGELFRCRCGSAEFIERPDDPKVKWQLSAEDKRMLTRHETKVRNSHDD